MGRASMQMNKGWYYSIVLARASISEHKKALASTIKLYRSSSYPHFVQTYLCDLPCRRKVYSSTSISPQFGQRVAFGYLCILGIGGGSWPWYFARAALYSNIIGMPDSAILIVKLRWSVTL